MSDKRTALIAGAVYCLLTQEGFASLAPVRRELLARLQQGPDITRKSIQALLDTSDLNPLEELLREHCFLTIRGEGESSTIAAFTKFIPSLADYINLTDADQAKYDSLRLSQTYDPDQFPAFASLDGKINREGLVWQLPLFGSSAIVEVSPITQARQLHQFRGLTPDFCYFDPHKNHTQMYLYAAHRSATMLGIWQVEGRKKVPLGIVPLVVFQPRNILPEEQDAPEVPYLYAEAAMLKEGCSRMLVKTRSGIARMAPALVDIVAVYAGLRTEEPFPVIGTSRKDDARYSEPVRDFIEAASWRWRRFVQNNVHQQSVVNPLGGKARKATNPRFTCTRYFEMPEDVSLLQYLQKGGYPFDTILFHSQDFLDEKRIKKEIGDTITPSRRILYEAWGEMRGWTHFVPIPEFYPVQQERIFGSQGVETR